MAAVVLAGQPEDVVAVEDAPDGGEGVADAEVEAEDGGAGGGRAGDHHAGEIGVDQPLQGLERAAVLLADKRLAVLASLLVEEGGLMRLMRSAGISMRCQSSPPLAQAW